MDLFSRLAAQQLGQGPALKPVLPPRFAPSPYGRAGGVDNSAGPLAGGPEATGSVVPPSSAGQGVLSDMPWQPPITAQGHRQFPSLQDARAQAHGLGINAHAPPPGMPATSTWRQASEAQAPAGARAVADPADPADPATPTGQAGRLPGDPPPLAAAVPGPLQRAEPGPLQAHSLRRPSATAAPPLTPARLQALSPQPAAAPPVVHVHIDRIELRTPATAPPRTATPRPARGTPQRSLTDYLRGGGQP